MKNKIFNSLLSQAKKAKNFALRHKVLAGIIMVLLFGLSYWTYGALRGNNAVVDYSTQAVEKGTLISSVSGSGQVSASEQIDIKAKTSGDAVYIGVAEGQTVKTGQLLLQIDTSSAEQAIRSAQTNLDNAQLALQKMQGITSDLGTIRGSAQKAQDTLDKSYEDGFNDISNVFLTMPSVIAGIHDLLFDYSANNYQQNIDWYIGQVNSIDTTTTPREYKDKVVSSYNAANDAFNKNFEEYRLTSRTSSQTDIYNLILETYSTAQKMSDAVKITSNFIDYVKKTLTDRDANIPSQLASDQSTLNGYTSATNGYLSNLLSDKNTIESGKETLINTSFDIKDQENQVEGLQNTLDDAKAALSDCYVRAPFDGVVAELNYKKGESVSNGSTVATVITAQGITEIPFNEVDIAKIEIGQKAVLTFDAIDGLTLAGQVAQVDVLGTVTQGVVNYNVKIAFDTQNSQIKPGMSVSASVITDAKQDALFVPNSAVKQQGNTSYVLVMSNGQPEQKAVQIGISNDTSTEIISGLEEGEEVVTQTITSNTSSSATQTNSNIRIPGVTGGGGFVR